MELRKQVKDDFLNEKNENLTYTIFMEAGQKPGVNDEHSVMEKRM